MRASASSVALDGLAGAGLGPQSHLLSWADRTFGQGLTTITKGQTHHFSESGAQQANPIHLSRRQWLLLHTPGWCRRITGLWLTCTSLVVRHKHQLFQASYLKYFRSYSASSSFCDGDMVARLDIMQSGTACRCQELVGGTSAGSSDCGSGRLDGCKG